MRIPKRRLFLFGLFFLIYWVVGATTGFSTMRTKCIVSPSLESLNSLKDYDDVVLAKVSKIDLITDNASVFEAGVDPSDNSKRPLYSVQLDSIEKLKGGFKTLSIRVAKKSGDNSCPGRMLIGRYEIGKTFLVFIKRGPQRELPDILCCSPTRVIVDTKTLDGHREKLVKLLSKK